jgi:hypothetical protein
MENFSFRERNRQRREGNAFENFYAYAQQTGIGDPKRTAERAARRIHGGRAGQSSNNSDQGSARTTPHRLDERTKDELYERAQELDIEGRSNMTKDELVDAIRDSQ